LATANPRPSPNQPCASHCAWSGVGI